MPDKPAFPPLDGSITVIPGFLDFHAEHNADRPWALLATELGVPAGAVSWRQLADATHRVAHAVRPNREGPDGQVVALIAHCDSITYHALQIGMIRAGLAPFPMSPRNTVAATASLMERTGSHRILSQPMFASLTSQVKALLEAKGWAVQVDDCPEFGQVYPELAPNSEAPEVVPYMFGKPSSLDDIALYMHSSGSTGMPKPIAHTFLNSLHWGKNSLFYDARKYGVSWGAMPLPPFHSFAFQLHLIGPFVSGYPIGLYAPKAPAPPVVPTPKNMLAACKATGINSIPIVPAFLEAWAHSDEDVAYLKTLFSVGYSGGPLSAQTGAKLQAAGVNFYSVYGSTEIGTPTVVWDVDDSQGLDNPHVKTSADWAWMRFPEHMSIRWAPQGDGSYELQVLTTESYKPSVENLPDVKGYSTRDLFIPHPTKSGLWRISGRQDDVIVLGSGEKVVPLPQEGVLLANTTVPLLSAVMFGREKNQVGVLLEPRPGHEVDGTDAAALSAFRNKIWPVVEEANRHAPTFARIYKEMVILADPKKPVPRAAKGTVAREQVLITYAKEIEELYKVVAESADVKEVTPPASWSEDDVREWLVKVTASVNKGIPLDPARDFFEQGFDSLDATFLRNRIVAMLKASGDKQAQAAAPHITQNFVFENPTIESLALALSTLVATGTNINKQNMSKEMLRILEQYSLGLPTPTAAQSSAASDGAVVLLSGATGNVGVYILAALLEEEKVEKVYTLNRPSPDAAKQARAFADKGLDVELLKSKKLVPLVGDMTKDAFGLAPDVLNELRESLTHVIHNAWRVDFNLALPAFEPYIASVRRVVDFAAGAPRPLKVLFTSSIAATGAWGFARGAVPEEPLGDPGVAVGTGYGASKFVSENLLAKAAEKGLECVSLRVGQTAGALPSGAWATTEWVPIMVKSSVALGKLPDFEGVVSWIPMSAVATAVRDAVVATERLPTVLNVVHPRPVPWKEVVKDLNAALGGKLEVVPFGEWLKAVEKVAVSPTAKDLQNIPAVLLLEFFRAIGAMASSPEFASLQDKSKVEAGGLPLYDTTKLQRVCPSVRNLDKIDAKLVEAWVGWWKEKGWISA